MKKVLLVIIAVVVTAFMSSTAEAKKTNGWDFLNTFFTGKGLDPDCYVVNSRDGYQDATVINAMQGKSVSITYDANKNASTKVQ